MERELRAIIKSKESSTDDVMSLLHFINLPNNLTELTGVTGRGNSRVVGEFVGRGVGGGVGAEVGYIEMKDDK